MKRMNHIIFGLMAPILTLSVLHAETRVSYKSAKSSSSYYQMGVQIAESIKAGSEGEIILTVEESQGSVQNVMEAVKRSGNFVFTTPPALVALAQKGQAMFEGKSNPKFDEIRALFPIPSLTMHFVVRSDADINSFADLEGKNILIGKGSFGAKEGEKYLGLFGLEGKVELSSIELDNAVPALKNKQIDGFITAGSYPAPNVVEAAASTPVKLLSLDDEQVSLTKRTRLIIPADTYAGVSDDVITTSLPVVAYTTTQMSDDIAYEMTKTFWAQKTKMASSAAWWKGVNESMLANIDGKVHPGAQRYYDEVGMPLTEANR